MGVHRADRRTYPADRPRSSLWRCAAASENPWWHLSPDTGTGARSLLREGGTSRVRMWLRRFRRSGAHRAHHEGDNLGDHLVDRASVGERLMVRVQAAQDAAARRAGIDQPERPDCSPALRMRNTTSSSALSCEVNSSCVWLGMRLITGGVTGCGPANSRRTSSTTVRNWSRGS